MATKAEKAVYIPDINAGQIEFAVLGTSPLINNRLSEKAKRELLLPRGRKTAADKAQNLKHNPIDEYQASPYTLTDGAPTYLAVMASAFKKAMMTAALDIPGAAKAQVGRLLYVDGEYAPIWGLPKLFMSITRNAGKDKTPDVRTRAIVPRWASLITVKFVTTTINEQSIMNLLTAAGITAGVGDWRPEKGSGSYGQFVVVSPDNPEYLDIVNTGGRDAQIQAMVHPECYDHNSAELLQWYSDELQRRGR